MKKIVYIILLFFALPTGVRADIYTSPYGVQVTMFERTQDNCGRINTLLQRTPLTTGHFQTNAQALDEFGHAYWPGQSATQTGGPHRAKKVGHDEDEDDPFMPAQIDPIGDTPWILFILLALAYAFRKKYAINNNVR